MKSSNAAGTKRIDTVQTETPSEQPKQDAPELPDYYPGAYETGVLVH